MDTTKDTTLTRNARLAELAAFAHELMAQYAGLPEIATVQLNNTLLGLPGKAAIELQVFGHGHTGVAAWAVELGVPVQFLAHDSYVVVFACTSVHDASVRLWTHLTRPDADRLLADLGLRMRDNRVSVAAFLLLAQPMKQGQAAEAVR